MKLNMPKKTYRRNGKYHREDGLALSLSSGYDYWCLDGVNLTEIYIDLI